MYLRIEVCVPYSLRELFDRSASNRLSELRSTALEAFNGDRKAAWDYISKSRTGWGEGMNSKSLFDQSRASPEWHKKAMNAIGQMVHGVYV